MKSLSIALLLVALSCGGGQTPTGAEADWPPLPSLSQTPIAQLRAAGDAIGLNPAQLTRLEAIDADLLAANAPLEDELATATGQRAEELRAQIDHNTRAALHRAFGLFDFPQRDRAIDELRDQGHDLEELFPIAPRRLASDPPAAGRLR